MFGVISLMFVAMEAGAIAAANDPFIGPRQPPSRWERCKDAMMGWFVVGLVLFEAAVIVGVFVGLAFLLGWAWRGHP